VSVAAGVVVVVVVDDIVVEESVLGISTDLYQRHIGEPGIGVRLDCLHDDIDIRTTRNTFRHILFAHELSRTCETRRCG